MAGKSAETIQTLLEAEKSARQVVDAAKKERDERLKKASAEAEAEIAQYRDMRENQYQEAVAKYQGSTGDVTKEIQERQNKEISAVREKADAEKKDAAARLVEWVMTCK